MLLNHDDRCASVSDWVTIHMFFGNEGHHTSMHNVRPDRDTTDVRPHRSGGIVYRVHYLTECARTPSMSQREADELSTAASAAPADGGRRELGWHTVKFDLLAADQHRHVVVLAFAPARQLVHFELELRPVVHDRA